MPTSVSLEYPKLMDPYLKGLWSGAITHEMSALNKPAPVDVRINTLKTTVDIARKSLYEDAIISKPTPMSPIGLRLSSKARLAETKAFKKGWDNPRCNC